jgi:hypothetical protein
MRGLLPALAITLGLIVAGPAVASSTIATQDLRAPDQTNSAVATQDLRAPDQTTQVAVAPAAALTADSGLSTALIVLLAVGGAAMLAATAVVGRRYAHGRGHTPV